MDAHSQEASPEHGTTRPSPEGCDQVCHGNIWGKSKEDGRAEAPRADAEHVLEAEDGLVWREQSGPADGG